jgi:hypothetical protein
VSPCNRLIVDATVWVDWVVVDVEARCDEGVEVVSEVALREAYAPTPATTIIATRTTNRTPPLDIATELKMDS